MNTPATLYATRVTHRRPGEFAYRFAYRTFHLRLDIDAIGAACAQSALISRNRFNLLSFYDADHGGHDGRSLRAWADALLAEYGVDLAGGRIELLAMPRVLGYAFHPISVYYCRHHDGTLRAIVAEVHNTFGEHYNYVLHNNNAPIDGRHMTKQKCFHVSPFFDRHGTYHFFAPPPDARLRLGIRLVDGDTTRIATALDGRQKPLTSARILLWTLGVPVMTFKVSAAIRWQAVKLWLRGARVRPKPSARQPNRS